MNEFYQTLQTQWNSQDIPLWASVKSVRVIALLEF